MFVWKLFKQQNTPKKTLSTIDTKSSRIFFSCKRGKEQKQLRPLDQPSGRAGVHPRGQDLDVQPSTPNSTGAAEKQTNKQNFFQFIIFPVMSQIREKPLVESNEEKTFGSVSLTEPDRVLVSLRA